MTTIVELTKVKRAYYVAQELGLTVKVEKNSLILLVNGMEVQIGTKQVNEWSVQYDTLIHEAFRDSHRTCDHKYDEKKLYDYISRARLK